MLNNSLIATSCVFQKSTIQCTQKQMKNNIWNCFWFTQNLKACRYTTKAKRQQHESSITKLPLMTWVHKPIGPHSSFYNSYQSCISNSRKKKSFADTQETFLIFVAQTHVCFWISICFYNALCFTLLYLPLLILERSLSKINPVC